VGNNINIDDLFKDRINQINDLPDNVEWNSKKGWSEYEKQYFTVKVKVRRIYYYLTAAASVLIMVALFVIFNRNDKIISVHNQTEEKMEFSLPDGNSVWLNKNSSIEYPSRIAKKQVKILVNGEVYIEISNLRSQQYTVKAHNAIVIAEALASFNIKSYPDEDNTDISVASGAIKIVEEKYKQGLALLVTQGNYCSVHRSQKLVYASINKNDNYLAWKTGKLIFNNQPLATVMDILDKYYDAKIELENDAIAYCLFSGSFEQKPIEVILNQIQSDLNLKIINTGKKIIFSGKGCL